MNLFSLFVVWFLCVWCKIWFDLKTFEILGCLSINENVLVEGPNLFNIRKKMAKSKDQVPQPIILSFSMTYTMKKIYKKAAKWENWPELIPICWKYLRDNSQRTTSSPKNIQKLKFSAGNAALFSLVRFRLGSKIILKWFSWRTKYFWYKEKMVKSKDRISQPFILSFDLHTKKNVLKGSQMERLVRIDLYISKIPSRQ